MDSQGMQDRTERIADFVLDAITGIAVVLVIISLIAHVYNKNGYVTIRIVTGSMEPAMQAGESYLFCTKFDAGGLQRGSVVLFENEELGNEVYVKRIIGLPGEIVQFEGGRISIDGTYLGKGMPLVDAGYHAIFEVPEGCYFVIGDNFNSSYDSRFWKNPYLLLSQIKGVLCQDWREEDGDEQYEAGQ